MSEIGRASGGDLVQTLVKQGQLEQVFQDHIQSGFKCDQ